MDTKQRFSFHTPHELGGPVMPSFFGLSNTLLDIKAILRHTYNSPLHFNTFLLAKMASFHSAGHIYMYELRDECIIALLRYPYSVHAYICD